MSEFLASLGLFGWACLVLFVFALATLPRALREMWTRPWKRDRKDGK
ncbi:hypothetical protein [Jannaschia ovalis]|uniref:Uncharacterized protein n=1 Tax=Jannaschia ovalis TaxID=3038773 RepID=A0ABY8LEF4_9RHOB|nr:hypothetical protein [Jannaschia sp. GRR-S6-38]WGH78690.1 hypothetical protein P8627_00035 [Jannaschia sp. GRR-S6-38]